MVLCIIDTFTNGRRFRNLTHTRKVLAKGTDEDNATRQIENVHNYYRDRYPLDDMTVRDCRLLYFKPVIKSVKQKSAKQKSAKPLKKSIKL